MSESVAIINTSAPFGGSQIKDSLDVAMIMGSYEQDIHLYFVGDGVYQLVAMQNPEILSIKDVFKTFAAFEFYDIEHLYVCEKSLRERGLSTDFHIEGVQILNDTELKNSVHQHNKHFRF